MARGLMERDVKTANRIFSAGEETVKKWNERTAIGLDELPLHIECEYVPPVTQPFVPEKMPKFNERANHFEITAKKSSRDRS